MRAHRGEYLAALLTIARAWIIAGKPAKDFRSDSYQEWIKGIRGLMEWAGFEGTFGAGEATVAVSSDDEEWHVFLVALYELFGDQPLTTRAITGKLTNLPEHTSPDLRLDAALLPGDLAQQYSRIGNGSDGGFRRSLGAWLRNHEGRYAVGWKLSSAGVNKTLKQPQYTVTPPAGHAP